MAFKPHVGDDASFQRWEKSIRAFVAFADDADEPPAFASAGALDGVSVGVKDIIDVAGLPTRNGSAACAEAPPATRDAPAVAALRAAGAAIIGKTTTTEFAFTDPTDCRNPHDLARSPGGSSSGSGAAVAAGMVDVALGTQTAGSLCRPAAYCGVVGLKPTYAAIPTEGVTPLAPTFDTVGVIAGSIDAAAAAFGAMREDAGAAEVSAKPPHRCAAAAVLLDRVTPPSTDAAAALREASAALGGICARLDEPRPKVDPAPIVADHRVVMNHEAARAHGAMLTDGRARRLKPKFLAGLQAGAGISSETAEAAATRLAAARADFWEETATYDLILTLPVPEGAPLIDGTTGFQDWLTPWTVFRGPLICLPWGLDTLGRPRSVMLAARPGADDTLIAAATALAAAAPETPRPSLPDA